MSDPLDVELGNDPTEIREGLSAAEVDPETRLPVYERTFAALAEEFEEARLPLDADDVVEVLTLTGPRTGAIAR
ncbi:arsenical pump-driving ATPase GET3 [Halomarina litorea]|uniref:arsenical pump-driving ATPase GET3 n=1 Tax=Halomarina litorea TaxID=2961595 RepID=UPI0021159EAA|nr:arsenical pump-driving ATPase GET3 [Halomarina sp. BCD28]